MTTYSQGLYIIHQVEEWRGVSIWSWYKMDGGKRVKVQNGKGLVKMMNGKGWWKYEGYHNHRVQSRRG